MSTTIKEANNVAFTAASTKERKTIEALLARVNATDVEHSDVKGYERWDSKFTIDGKKYLCEIKCRNVKHTAYADTLIEVSKVNAMRKLAKEEQRVPLLIINFTDEVCYVFNLNDDSVRSVKPNKMYCNATTAVLRDRIEKEVMLLPFRYGKKIDLTDKIDKN